MKIAIVGAGGVGCQAARHLAKDGHDVTLFERFALDHDQGSSFGESRVIRKFYPDDLYTRMMGFAYGLWDDLQAESGEDLFVRCGGLYYGRTDNADLGIAEKALISNQVRYERLTAAEACARFPAFRLRADEFALYQPDAGFLRASACVKAAARLAVKHGAALREHVIVRKIVKDGAGVRLETTAGDFGFERAIVTAGPWLGELFADLKLPLRVSRQQYLYLKPKSKADAQAFESSRCPVWLHEGSLVGGEYYGFPSDGRVPGVKFAQHKIGPLVDPNAVDRDFDPALKAEMLAYAAERMPGLSDEVTYSKTCLYTNTPETDFIVDAVPGLPGTFAVGGLSGHGYKFLVLLGRMAADLATGRTLPVDVSRFSFARFKA